MTCARTRHRLSAWLEGDLGETERERVRSHLQGCGECRAELDALKQTVARLSSLAECEAPHHLASRIIARLRDGEGAPGWREDLAAWLAGLDLRAAGAALVIGALSALAVQRLAAPDPLREAENLRAALREGTAPVPELDLGPRFGAGAAPEADAPPAAGPVGTGADALLDAALDDPTTLLRHWRALDVAQRAALAQRLAMRAAERGDAQALTAALREMGAEAGHLAERLAAPRPGSPVTPF
jgi:anti-sigma factor RsiW